MHAYVPTCKRIRVNRFNRFQLVSLLLCVICHVCEAAGYLTEKTSITTELRLTVSTLRVHPSARRGFDSIYTRCFWSDTSECVLYLYFVEDESPAAWTCYLDAITLHSPFDSNVSPSFPLLTSRFLCRLLLPVTSKLLFFSFQKLY